MASINYARLSEMRLESHEWSPIEVFIVENLLKERKQELSTRITNNLQTLFDPDNQPPERYWCQCSNPACYNKKNSILIVDKTVANIACQVQVRNVGSNKITLANNKKNPAYMAIRPNSIAHRYTAAATIQA